VLTLANLLTSSQTLNSKPEQQWYLQNGNTSIQLVDTTLCMDAGGASERAFFFLGHNTQPRKQRTETLTVSPPPNHSRLEGHGQHLS